VEQADREANRFKEFRHAVEKDSKAKPLDVRNNSHEESGSQSYSADSENLEVGMQQAEHDPFDVAEEIWLLEQIKDIQDELNILKIVILDQTSVIDRFCKLQPNAYYALKEQRTVRNYGDEVKRITMHADRTYQTVCMVQ